MRTKMAARRSPFLIGALLFCLIQISIAENDNAGDTEDDTDSGRITDSKIMRLILKALRDTEKLHKKQKSDVDDEEKRDEKVADVTDTENYEDELRNNMHSRSDGDENNNGGASFGEEELLPDQQVIVHNEGQENDEPKRGREKDEGESDVPPDQQVILNEVSKQVEENEEPKGGKDKITSSNSQHQTNPTENAENQEIVPPPINGNGKNVLHDQRAISSNSEHQETSRETAEGKDFELPSSKGNGKNVLHDQRAISSNSEHQETSRETAEGKDFELPSSKDNGENTLPDRRATSSNSHHKETLKETAEGKDFALPSVKGPDKRNFGEYVKFWKDGKVPFCIKPNSFGEESERTIRNIINTFNSQTCVQWTEVACDSDTHHVVIENHPQGCGSYVGYQEGMKNQLLALKEPECMQRNAIEHEMLHTLGMVHEQSRKDRDKYVDIVWSNVVGGKSNGNYGAQNTHNYGVPYDYGSVMQYSVYAQALIGNKPAMKLTAGSRFNFLTEANGGLSFYDVMLISRAYKCTEDCGGKGNIPWCENGGFLTHNVQSHKCTCHCPRGLEGDRCEKIKDPSGCSEIIDLKDEQSEHTQRSPAGSDGHYRMGVVCHYLIRAPPEYRIKAFLKNLDIPVYSKRSCRNWLEIKDGLIGQRGLVYCGKSDHPITFSTPKDYRYKNLMMMKFNSTAKGPSGAGFKITFTIEKSTAFHAKSSGPCIPNPCKHDGECKAFGHWITEYTCQCKDGFTGRNCLIREGKNDEDIVFACGSDDPRDCAEIANQQVETSWKINEHDRFTAEFHTSLSNVLGLGKAITTHSCLTFSYITQTMSGQGACGEFTTELLTKIIMTGHIIDPFPVAELQVTGCNDEWKTQTLDINVYHDDYFKEEATVKFHVKEGGRVMLDNIKIVKGHCDDVIN